MCKTTVPEEVPTLLILLVVVAFVIGVAVEVKTER